MQDNTDVKGGERADIIAATAEATADIKANVTAVSFNTITSFRFHYTAVGRKFQEKKGEGHMKSRDPISILFYIFGIISGLLIIFLIKG